MKKQFATTCGDLETLTVEVDADEEIGVTVHIGLFNLTSYLDPETARTVAATLVVAAAEVERMQSEPAR